MKGLPALLLIALAGTALQAQDSHAPSPSQPAAVDAPAPMPALRITSPLGRTGAPATVRIVAQIQWPPDALKRPLQVRFLVDGALVGTVDSGPPYAVTWMDENPFESRKIVVEAEDGSGAMVADSVTLPAFEISDETEVASILVDTTVYDEAGHAVSNLDKAQFVVRENSEPQTVDLFTRESLPSTVVLLVDNSQSMRTRMPAVRQAAQLFAESLGRKEKLIVAPFNHRLGVITGPTDDVETTTDAIVAMRAGGGTAILNALDQVTTLLHGVEGRRAVILITDGFDENSTIDVRTAVRKAQAEHITVYTVAMGGVMGVSLHGENTFREVSGGTGGRSFFPWRESDLAGVAREITNDEDSRYLITYTPSNQIKDGTWRAINVEVPKGYKARARTGYQAALPPPVRPEIEFRATDRAKTYANISAEDVEVIEDGITQSIDTFQEAVDPVAIALLLDESGSMTKSAGLVHETAREFVNAVRPEDSLALITFADTSVLEHGLSKSRQLSLDAIEKYKPIGGTALYDALWDAFQQLRSVSGRRAVVVLTDGRDENNPGTAPGSAHSIEEVLELGREVGATVFPIGLGTRVDTATLEHLARVSGGEAYFSPDPAQLAEQFEGIVENLRQRYVLSYTSTNTRRDGAWRRVEVRGKSDALVVTTAGGYFAPGP